MNKIEYVTTWLITFEYFKFEKNTVHILLKMGKKAHQNKNNFKQFLKENVWIHEENKIENFENDNTKIIKIQYQ